MLYKLQNIPSYVSSFLPGKLHNSLSQLRQKKHPTQGLDWDTKAFCVPDFSILLLHTLLGGNRDSTKIKEKMKRRSMERRERKMKLQERNLYRERKSFLKILKSFLFFLLIYIFKFFYNKHELFTPGMYLINKWISFKLSPFMARDHISFFLYGRVLIVIINKKWHLFISPTKIQSHLRYNHRSQDMEG